MQANTEKTMPKLLEKIGRKFGENTKQSLEQNKVVVPTASKPDNITKTQYEALSLFEQKTWDMVFKRYMAAEQIVEEDLAKILNILWSCCHSSLQSQIEARPDYESKIKGKAGALKLAIETVTYAACAHENVYLNLIGSVLDLFLVRGQDYKTLGDYQLGFERRAEVASRCGFEIANTKLRDLRMKELKKLGAEMGAEYRALEEWESDEADTGKVSESGQGVTDAAFEGAYCCEAIGT